VTGSAPTRTTRHRIGTALLVAGVLGVAAAPVAVPYAGSTPVVMTVTELPEPPASADASVAYRSLPEPARRAFDRARERPRLVFESHANYEAYRSFREDTVVRAGDRLYEVEMTTADVGGFDWLVRILHRYSLAVGGGFALAVGVALRPRRDIGLSNAALFVPLTGYASLVATNVATAPALRELTPMADLTFALGAAIPVLVELGLGGRTHWPVTAAVACLVSVALAIAAGVTPLFAPLAAVVFVVPGVALERTLELTSPPDP
jgi:hypothetical protein